SIILWDISNVGQLLTIQGYYGVDGVQFSPDGQRALTVSQDFTLALWYTAADVSDYGPTIWNLISTQNYQSYPTAAALSPDGWHAITGSCGSVDENTGLCNGGELVLWDVNSAVAVWRASGHSAAVTAAAFSPDGRFALTGSCAAVDAESSECTRGEMILWDVSTAQPLRTFTAHTDNIITIRFSPDGTHALSYASDNTLVLWDINGETPLYTFNVFEDQIYTFAYSPDGLTVLIGDENGSLTLWDTNPASPTLGRLLHPFTGHSQRVTSIAFSPNGTQALSGARDGSLILWDVATGEAVHVFPRYSQAVVGIGFSPDGHRALVSDGYNMNLWEINGTLPELITWLYGNRYVDTDLSCGERERFDIEPLCDEQGSAPTMTLFPTLAPPTATPTFTPSPTVNATLTTLTPTMTVTPTFTPTATPAFGGLAVYGEQCGFVPLEGNQTWEFRAQAGDHITIAVTSPCASAGEDQIPFDTTLSIYAPDGSQISFNDTVPGIDLNSRLEDLPLPVGGTYTISVGSYNSVSGSYTLVLISAGCDTHSYAGAD
ncbi:MAG: WD40 repeat domain-containing protein, partial [Anaerolineae bacterium]